MPGPDVAFSLGRALAAAGASACLLGGCGSTGGVGGGLITSSTVAGYQPASIFSPNGYSVSANADGSLRVTAGGPPETPAPRLEKIALARAAEYGDEQHLKVFKATAPETSIKCGKDKATFKGERVKIHPTDYRFVAIDVSYSSDTSDPQAKRTRETAETLKAEIAAETVPPEEQAAAAQEVAQHCGR